MNRNFAARLALVVAITLFVAPNSRAQTSFTWTAFASGNWSNGGNWSGGNPPPSVNTTDLIFPGILDQAYTATNDIGTPFVLHSLSFDNQADMDFCMASEERKYCRKVSAQDIGKFKGLFRGEVHHINYEATEIELKPAS